MKQWIESKVTASTTMHCECIVLETSSAFIVDIVILIVIFYS